MPILRTAVNDNNPVPAVAVFAGIARPADLVHRLEHDLGPRALRDLRRAVVRIVVAHDQLGLPAEPGESFRGRADAGERAGQQSLFVERGNDDGDLHFLGADFSITARATAAATSIRTIWRASRR